MKSWINKDEWDLDIAWSNWRKSTIGIRNMEIAKSHPSYKEVERILKKIKDKNN